MYSTKYLVITNEMKIDTRIDNKFENIVNNQNGIYHISNSLDLDIK